MNVKHKTAKIHFGFPETKCGAKGNGKSDVQTTKDEEWFKDMTDDERCKRCWKRMGEPK